MVLKELKAEIGEKGVTPLQVIDNRACAILIYRRLCDLKRQPLTALDSQQRGKPVSYTHLTLPTKVNV